MSDHAIEDAPAPATESLPRRAPSGRNALLGRDKLAMQRSLAAVTRFARSPAGRRATTRG